MFTGDISKDLLSLIVGLLVYPGPFLLWLITRFTHRETIFPKCFGTMTILQMFAFVPFIWAICTGHRMAIMCLVFPAASGILFLIISIGILIANRKLLARKKI